MFISGSLSGDLVSIVVTFVVIFDDPLSAHIASLRGTKWRNMRAKLTPTFTSGKMRMMFQTLVDCEVGLQKQMEMIKVEGGSLTMNEVAAQSFVFFLAGFETSSTLMTFTLYELARNQDVQQKLRDEIKIVLAKHDGKTTYDSINEMKYLNQVIDESLRVWPPAPLTSRYCVKDYKIPDEDVIIEKGTTVLIPILGIHYDEEYYPDPEKFDPERFSEENKNSRHHYTHLPFGEGPRNCIGMRFGLMQAKMGLASLLKNFKFTVNKKTKEPLKLVAHSIILTVEVVVVCYYKWAYQYWRRKNVPYLTPTVPFGNMGNAVKGKEHLGITIKRIYDEMKANGWKHGGIYTALSPTYFLIDLDYVRNITTKDFQYFLDHASYYNEEDDPLSAHLAALTGKRWQNLRAKLTPAFTSGKMRMMFQILLECEANLQKQMKVMCGKRQAIDIKEVLSRFTTDVIGSCAFGLDCKSFEDENSPVRVYFRKNFDEAATQNLKKIFAMNFPKLAKMLHITMIPRDVSDFFLKMFRDTVDYREKNHYSRNDFMQLLIDMKNNRFKGEDGNKVHGSTLTMNEIAAQSFVFFLAGFETSSTLMTFALYELARNQDIHQRLRDEIETVSAKHDGKITYDSINEMKYLSQVIDESLRMYPPALFTSRHCVKDYKIPDEDIIIEKGTTVLIPILGIHHDEEYYPDPEKFDPERFSEENKNSRHCSAFIPFGEGPRNTAEGSILTMNEVVAQSFVFFLGAFQTSSTLMTFTPHELSRNQVI
ncbi:p450 domain containing protein [Asbolus verrucosus]|uniref:p450 domain containing protein n=1 Tax=Asbolus verrucosus TaxID=1661398 RepID=A0A482VD26_ASBVE|nr:p450 domain containing protein [Asbolus verrucosus]